MKLSAFYNQGFPVWAVAISALALAVPGWFASLQGAIVPLLALVMFCMGLTLKPADFRRVALMPHAVATGLVLQFTIMPLAAFLLARLLQLPPDLTAGLVLVGSCAGGTASNVICYLARGDVALSITMTMSSTLIGVVATPLLCTLYLSTTVEVDTTGMLMDIVQIVLVPVAVGTLISRFMENFVTRVEPLLPGLSVTIILVIIAIIVALNADRLLVTGTVTMLAVLLHNSSGLVGGYWLSRAAGLNRIQARTVAIETGMQNSGLGVALALEFFSATAALPGALFSIWHNISGSLLAAYWRDRPAEPNDANQ